MVISFLFLTVFSLGTIQDLGKATANSMSSDQNNRGFAHFFDEMPLGLIGIEKSRNDLLEIFHHVKSGSAGSAVSELDLAMRRQATSREQTNHTLFIGDRGSRENNVSHSSKNGTISGTMNNSIYESGGPNAQRFLYHEIAKSSKLLSDALDKMTSEDDATLLQGRLKGWAALQEWSKRIHYLATLCHILMTAGVLPFIDSSLSNKRYNATMMHLHHLGYPGGARDMRPYETTTQLCCQLALERVITLVFDMGIGGPDPSKPFQISDMECMVPLLTVPETVTAIALELSPTLLDPVFVQIFQTLQRVCNWYPGTENARSQTHSEYYCDQTLLNKYKSGNGRGSEGAAAVHLTEQLSRRGVMYQNKTVVGALATLMKECIPAYSTDGTYQMLPGIIIEGPGEANQLLVHHKLIDNFSDPDALWKAYCAVAGRVDCKEEEAPLFVRGVTLPDDPGVAAVGRFYAADDVVDFKTRERLAKRKYDEDVKAYEKALENFPREKDEIKRLTTNKVISEKKIARYNRVLDALKIQTQEALEKQDEKTYAFLQDEQTRNEAECAVEHDKFDNLVITIREREKELDLKRRYIDKPTMAAVHNPRRLKNPNYQPPEKAKKVVRGGLGDMDMREVSNEYIEEDQPEYIVPAPDDEYKAVYRFNKKQGVVKTEAEFKQHYANPGNLPVLVNAYYRFREAACNVYDVLQRIQTHKVRVAYTEGKEIETSHLHFLDRSQRYTEDSNMPDAAGDTDEEKQQEDVWVRLKCKLERRFLELTKVYCERWNTYLSYKALKRDSLHSHWVYADLMINWFRLAVNNQSWTTDAVVRLSKVIFQAWQTGDIQQEELQKLSRECVYGVVPLDVDDNKDVPPALEDESKMEEERQRDNERTRMLVEKYTNRYRRKRPRRVEEYSDAEEAQGVSSSNVPVLSDSSADDEPTPVRRRFTFLDEPDSATRDCIAPPPSSTTDMDMD